ncbi:MAG: peptidoglycan-binding domain-containing protein [Thainema sp.]
MQANSISTQRPLLQRGSRGEAVRELQTLLNQRIGALPLTVDGIFGQKTEFVVQVMQYRLYLAEDGIVGPKTWASLEAGYPVNMPVLRQGSRNVHVERLQRVFASYDELITSTYHVGPVDGIFGPKTEAAVKRYQDEQQLVIDGIVGANTWKALGYISHRVSHATL